MADRFPIDELLARLRAADFDVGVAQYLRVYRLVDVIGADASPGELQRSLRPLFVSNENQQERFDEVFASIVADFRGPQGAAASDGAITREEMRHGPTDDRKRLPVWARVAIAAGIVVLCVMGLEVWKGLMKKEPEVPAPVVVIPDTSGTAGTTTTGGTVSDGTRAIPAPQPVQLPAATTASEPGPVRWELLAKFILLLLGAGALADVVLSLRRRFAAREIAGRKPPFDWRRSWEPDAEIFDSQPMQQAANALRGRLAGERMEVDLRRSIRATLDGAGFPNLHYLGSAQSPEYVALIDRRSPDDHLAAYYELLAGELVAHGAAIDIYTFQGDPRVCTARDGTSIELISLRSARPTAKLLVFSDAAGLVDVRTGEVLPWADRELGWDQRALLVPAIPEKRRLALLSTHFAVERADAAGLLRFAQHFASATATRSTPASDPPLSDSPSVAQARKALSADVFRWLTTCAAQRSLEWNTTIALGRITHPTATESDMLDLVRLGWFRRGSIPEPIRRELLAILAKDQELNYAAHRTIAEELRRRSADAPRGSFAAEGLVVEAVAHELRASNGLDPKTAAELRLLDPALIRRDDDLPDLLAPERAGISRPPSRWSRVRYRAGFAALGPSAIAFTVLALALSAVIASAGVVGELLPNLSSDQAPPDSAASGAEILVGEFGSLTGPQATFGQSTHNGIMLAVDEINAAGGINGRKIKVVTEDDESRAEEAANVVTKLIAQNNVVAVLGSVVSSASLVVAPICQANKVPMITPATHPLVTQRGDYIFSTSFINDYQGSSLAGYVLRTLDVRTAAIFTDVRSDYSTSLASSFERSFVAGGGRIVARQSYANSDTDFRAQLTLIKQARPQIIFLPGYYTDVGQIAIQARDLNIMTPLVGGDGWESPKLIEIGGRNLEGCYYASPYFPGDPAAEVRNFVDRYSERYGITPDAVAALGHDGITVLADAIKRAGTLDGPKLRDAIAATRGVAGVTGAITLGPDRNPAGKKLVIVEIKSGELVLKATVQPQ